MNMSTGHFPIGAMGSFLQHAPTVVDRSVRSCANESRGKHVSHFPIGRWDFEASGADSTYSILEV